MSKIAKDFEVWVGDVERGLLYSVFARQNAFSFSALIFGLAWGSGMLLSSVASGCELSKPATNTEPTGLATTVALLMLAAIPVVGYLLNRLRAVYWPVASFALGHGAKRDDDKNSWRMFWVGTVLLSILTGVVINLLI